MNATTSRKPLALFLVVVLAAFTQGSACFGTTVDPGLDSGPDDDDEIECESAEDCPDPANYDCLGICLQRCAADGACKLDEYCSSRGYCEEGCRDSSTCPNDEVCVGGACREPGGAGSCGTKCDCDPGQVCLEGVCQDPPAECVSPDDCPRGPADRCEDYLCNGFTKQCFDDDPDPCSTATDCAGRPGCEEGCACSPNSDCVPSAACTAHDDCGDGFYCTSDLQCDVAPACTAPADCTPLDLACNDVTHTCEPPRPCTSNAQCTTPPSTFCNVGAGACTVPRCDNGGITCQPNQECGTNGTCVISGTGTACTSDAECPNDAWPNTQFCNFQTAGNNGECSVGCRSNASCPQNQQCNAARQCTASGGGGGGGLGQVGSACDEPGLDPDCPSGTLCKLDTYTCEETCETVGSCSGGACCSLSGHPNCTQGVFFNWCTP